jgi:Flp pilus assembly protein TadD
MNRISWCGALAACAALSVVASAAENPKRSSSAQTAEEALQREQADVARLEASAPRSAVHERKLQLAPDSSAERLKAAEAYILEAGESPSKLDAAAEHVNAVLQSSPGNVTALLLAGRINMMKNQPSLAQASYQAAAAADPTNASAFLGLGESWSRLGNEEQASASYREYRRLIGLPPISTAAAEPLPPGQAPPVIIGPGKSKPQPTRPRR